MATWTTYFSIHIQQKQAKPLTPISLQPFPLLGQLKSCVHLPQESMKWLAGNEPGEPPQDKTSCPDDLSHLDMGEDMSQPFV